MDHGGRYTSPTVCHCHDDDSTAFCYLSGRKNHRLQLLQVVCCIYVGNLVGLAVPAGCSLDSALVSPSA